jgi:UV DNA damage endonuclease
MSMRMGFPVKIVGNSDLKSNDSRRWQNDPHLRVSLEYLHRILDYLREHSIHMYRMSSDLAPYVTHPDLPQFHGMIQESKSELRSFGIAARQAGIRLSFHPSQYIVLNSRDPVLTRKSIADIEAQSEMLDLMELGQEAVVVIHVGGAYGDRESGRRRWVDSWGLLSEGARRRLVLENDDLRFGPADTLWIHQQTGVRLVFDYQHFWCFNPEKMELVPTLEAMIKTWPEGTRPKIHFSSPKTESPEHRARFPQWTRHADYVNPFEFATFMRAIPHLEFDVMLESKLKDMALLQLRRDLLRYAPDVGARFDAQPGQPKSAIRNPSDLP